VHSIAALHDLAGNSIGKSTCSMLQGVMSCQSAATCLWHPGAPCVQAAAHGVPTVATKNGGPVDIMKTLHHGVTVDPTNERELGNALLDILTHPATWQEMSRNGARPPARAL
jgi:glycosyltransferase involved in cell wall biosynthesis